MNESVKTVANADKAAIARRASYGLLLISGILVYVIKANFTPTPDHSEVIGILGPIGIGLAFLGAILGKHVADRTAIFFHVMFIALFAIILMTSGEISMIYLAILFPVFIFVPILVSAGMGVTKLAKTVVQKDKPVASDSEQ